jgi:UDP-GlcNAc3NAcA epimerase
MAQRRPLALCYGTRPQVIKTSVLAAGLGARWPLLRVDTGQHYDHELNALLYQQLGIAPPDQFLEVGSGSHAQQTAAVLERAAAAFERSRPWAVVVIGDTNSTLGGALAAVKLQIPVVHVEAGMRAADRQLAEEINRRAVDAISAVWCAPSVAAAERLRREGADRGVVVTGDIARDVLERHAHAVGSVATIAGWPLRAGEPYAFTTLHRAELTDDPERLRAVLAVLGTLDLPVVLPLHPRTRRAITEAGLGAAIPSRVHCLPPVGYLQSLACVREAGVVVTDSGGVQREAYWLGRPCVTVRDETEWEETVACGANVVVPPEAASATLAEVVRERLDHPRTWGRDALGLGDAAGRIADAIEQIAPTDSA